MESAREFGLLLRTLREERNLTQEDLAELIDRSVQAVSKMERGLTLPKLETLIRLSAKLNVPLSDLTKVFDCNQSISSERQRIEFSIIDSSRKISMRDLKILQSITNSFPREH
ncbi:helix-turn-helix domain-containing protein [Azospirillum brasilense]|nr:helix-turn-helix domain-containing protein [Azospirillum brasilense]